jgi:hypothetical protein
VSSRLWPFRAALRTSRFNYDLTAVAASEKCRIGTILDLKPH